MGLYAKLIVSGCMAGYAIAAWAGETIVYNYDAQGRLMSEIVAGSSDNNGLQLGYVYDLNTNRLVQMVTGSKNRGQQIVTVPLNGFTLIPVNP